MWHNILHNNSCIKFSSCFNFFIYFFFNCIQSNIFNYISFLTRRAAGRVKPRKKKKRKTVLPASYVEGVAPDPERWMPRWQRKSGGGRRRRDRKKEKDVGRGTQGGTGDAADR